MSRPLLLHLVEGDEARRVPAVLEGVHTGLLIGVAFPDYPFRSPLDLVEHREVRGGCSAPSEERTWAL